MTSKTTKQTSKTTALQKYDQPITTVDEAIDYLNAHINTDKLSPQEQERMQEAVKFLPDLAAQIGNLAFQARNRIIGSGHPNAIVKESIHEKVTELRNEMGYKEASTLERLLIEQVVICWLRMYQLESAYTGIMEGSLTLAQGTYWDRRLTVTQGRYLRAMETLARVRRLLKPVPVQVNIAGQGGQQINTVKASNS